MSNETELKAKFWKALKSDRTGLIGLRGGDASRAQPMTFVLDGDETEAAWIFSAADVDLVKETGAGAPALLHFASKGHDLFATVDGRLTIETDREMVERLWNPFIAAWYEGKDDPKLRLLRFEPGQAQIWLNENSLFAGVKLLLGIDPKKDYDDKTAQVRLS